MVLCNSLTLLYYLYVIVHIVDLRFNRVNWRLLGPTILRSRGNKEGQLHLKLRFVAFAVSRYLATLILLNNEDEVDLLTPFSKPSSTEVEKVEFPTSNRVALTCLGSFMTTKNKFEE